jgi:hypothetical protein
VLSSSDVDLLRIPDRTVSTVKLRDVRVNVRLASHLDKKETDLA